MGKMQTTKLADGVWNLQHVTFKWISGAKIKSADCLSWLVELPTSTTPTVNMLTVMHTDGPAFNTRSHIQKELS